MTRIPFFGSDDDETEEESVDIETRGDVDVIDLENPDEGAETRGNVEVVDIAEIDEGTTEVNGVTIHAISIEEETTDPQTEPAGPAGRASPEVTPDPGEGPATRGTFAFPNDRDFMQKLEARAVNGDDRFTETVYVLTGPSYTQPTDLFRLDNRDYYGSTTRTSVSFKPRKMARKVAACFPDGQAPGVIARFHTHPPGSSPTPSDQDKQSAKRVRRAFEQAFSTDSFEFFHGIHALDEHGLNPNPDDRQSPSIRQKDLRWLGERYRHKLAVYGTGHTGQKTITIAGDS
jgi:hypothetical protein